ncbi:MAG: hypothetical protein AB8B81_17880 [Halioglobus sp.]
MVWTHQPYSQEAEQRLSTSEFEELKNIVSNPPARNFNKDTPFASEEKHRLNVETLNAATGIEQIDDQKSDRVKLKNYRRCIDETRVRESKGGSPVPVSESCRNELEALSENYTEEIRIQSKQTLTDQETLLSKRRLEFADKQKLMAENVVKQEDLPRGNLHEKRLLLQLAHCHTRQQAEKVDPAEAISCDEIVGLSNQDRADINNYLNTRVLPNEKL